MAGIRKTDLRFCRIRESHKDGRQVLSRSCADSNITNSTTTAMAPNFTLHKRALTQTIINSKLQGEDGPKDDEIAEINGYTARMVRRVRSSLLCFRTTTAPPNGADRPKTIAPESPESIA
ncbi:hypothetical protein B0H67DRAFT_575863 [Lasiosphaeris hirsuta]|uniref:Uncharacterized protein n=1 Tax=Lasiosphaeris hirsuta TaxID=260670 RepID=A0AA40AQW5_9PEZI|nr:hypothetical protein B0H67DRAFT_575863 [Lasiosphaeris hirsuta]